jgi:transcriptional regulator with XRE-family HTH domain
MESPTQFSISKTRTAIAASVRAERARSHLSQKDVSAGMRRLGYSWHHQTVGQVERCTRPVGADELIALAAVFGIDPGMLWRLP